MTQQHQDLTVPGMHHHEMKHKDEWCVPVFLVSTHYGTE